MPKLPFAERLSEFWVVFQTLEPKQKKLFLL